jgi:putative two-component system response regulator
MYGNEKILMVDDDLVFLAYVSGDLKDTFDIITVNSGMRGLELLEKDGPFALVVVDYQMPEMNGVEFLEKIREKYPETVRMMITGVRLLESGMDVMNNIHIYRFINKPCSAAVLGEIFKKGIEQYRLVQSEKIKRDEADAANRQLMQYAKALNEAVASLKNKNRELNDAYYDTIRRLVVASEYKDNDTHDHILRMSRYSALLAEKLGFSPEEVENILFASPMHDVGKIGIPDAIMMKPGKLSTDEFDEMKNHTLIGARILEGSNAKILDLAGVIAVSHHERWDGSGYPYGLSGDAIPFNGRIVALADTFDALTSRRPYKDAYPADVAYGVIKKERERQFDPAIVDVFLDNYDAFLKIKDEVSVSDRSSDGGYTLSERDTV